ncbi:Endoglucanase-7 [Orbilia brochopaga]|nr:Endoglucanase-7 [Drechslerella brochopaga]
MKLQTASLILLSSSLASAHYTFPGLIFNGATSADWQYVKMTTNKYSHGPITDVNSNDMRCYKDPAAPVASTANVAAGATVGFRVDPNIFHPGPLLFYLAKVPSGKTAANFEGDGGAVWFKIYENQATITSSSITWPSGQTTVSVKIPSCIPSGQYLLRVEHIALHSASSAGGAQIYIACGQINVTGGGSKAGSPLVAFPGAYKATDPGLLINIYWPIPTSYKAPGPAVFTC